MLLFLTLLFYLGISYKLKGTFLRAHFDNPGQVYTPVGFLGGSDGKESACDEGDLALGWDDPLEEGMATHSSILAWRIPMDRGAWQDTVHGTAELE